MYSVDAGNKSSYDASVFNQHVAGSLASARVVLHAMFELSPFESVIDVGCGLAPWLRAAQDLGAKGLGLDSDCVDRTKLLVEPTCFSACDLEAENLRDAVPSGLKYDLVMCMEVAAHLSSARAESFINELCSLSDLILFSAATPEQDGANHINEQWPAYWSALFRDSGFDCYDALRKKLWHRDDCEWWYIQNVLVFGRRDSRAVERFARRGVPAEDPMPLVHPRQLRQTSESFRCQIRELQQAVIYQPFGRDEGVRALEAKVDQLRGIVLAGKATIDALQKSAAEERSTLQAQLASKQAESDAFARQVAALYDSTSWRLAAPLRWIARIIKR